MEKPEVMDFNQYAHVCNSCDRGVLENAIGSGRLTVVGDMQGIPVYVDPSLDPSSSQALYPEDIVVRKDKGRDRSEEWFYDDFASSYGTISSTCATNARAIIWNVLETFASFVDDKRHRVRLSVDMSQIPLGTRQGNFSDSFDRTFSVATSEELASRLTESFVPHVQQSGQDGLVGDPEMRARCEIFIDGNSVFQTGSVSSVIADYMAQRRRIIESCEEVGECEDIAVNRNMSGGQVGDVIGS